MTNDSRKQSLYFPEEMLDEVRREADRLERSMSWVIQYAWKHYGRMSVQQLPSMEPECSQTK